MSNPKSEFRNPTLSAHDYERFRALILERTGMLFGPRRHDELAGGVLAAAERAGCESLGDYCLLLQEARTDSELWDDLIGAITVGETYFFRNSSHFDALRRYILPDLMARHRDDRRLRIWSAGCSSGEEPCSLAILLRQLLPDIANWNIFILATDINKQALRQARQSCYREWSFRQTDPAIREGYFTPLNRSSGKARGRQDRLFELSPQVREMVTFAYLNLAEDAYPSLATNTNAMDLILCRNVAIYLPEAVIREMAERFHRCLVTDGWLIVGASETNSMIYDQFAVRNCCGALLYQKVAVLPSPLVCPELPGEPFDAVQETPVEWPPLQPVVQPLPLLPTPPAPRPEPLDLTFDVTLQQTQDSAQDEDRVVPTGEGPPQPRGKPAGPERSRKVEAPAVPADPYQEGLHGLTEVDTALGQGTTFTMTLPLTLATSRVLLVEVAGQTVAVPAMTVERILRVEASAVGRIEGRPAIRADGRPLPLVSLAQVLELPEVEAPLAPGQRVPVVVLGVVEKRIAFRVDGFRGAQEVVIKNLGPQLSRVRNVAGATILGSGEVVMILNVADLMKTAQVGPAMAAPLPVEVREVRRRRVLVVDDSITTRTLEKNILESAGYEVLVAADGEEAWALVQSEPLDAVAADIAMPRLDGFVLAEKVKSDERFRELPVVLVTSLESPQDKIRGLEAGADAYITKSTFDQLELLETIERLIG